MDENERYALGDRLEQGARKLQSRLRGHFVDDKSACLSCKYAQVMRRSSKNNRVIHCGPLGQYVPNDIIECSDYASITSLSMQTMAGIAYIIELDKRKLGFQGDEQ